MRVPKYTHFVMLLISLMATDTLLRAVDSKQKSQQGSSGATWAQQAMLALTGGTPVGSVTESGSVTLTVGDDQESGTVSLQSSGLMTSQLTLTTGAGNRSETRSWDNFQPSGTWTGLDGQQHAMATVNCWTDPVWFFPALSLLAGYADPTLVFTDLGQVQYSGGNVEHIQVYRYISTLPDGPLQVVKQFSTVDYYLDSNTALPVAMSFSRHGDRDPNANIPMAAVFSQYQSVGGIQIPFQVTALFNGTPWLQINITNAQPSGQSMPAQKH